MTGAEIAGGGAAVVAVGLPSVGDAIRATLRDVYDHMWLLVAANVLWSLAVIVWLLLLAAAPLAGLLAQPCLGFAIAPLFRLAGGIVRGGPVSLGAALRGRRGELVGMLLLTAAQGIVVVVLAGDLLGGLIDGSPGGVAIATLAGWGLVASWLVGWTAWALLGDPLRAGTPVTRRLRLAAALVFAHPLRSVALGVVLLAFVVASGVAIVAILTISMSVAAVFAARVVLPAADRVEGRLAPATS